MRRLSALILLLSISSAAYAAEFRVVAHPGVPITKLTKSAASAIFLKKTSKWSDGSAVVPIDQSRRTTIREKFTAAVHGKSLDAILNYWNQQIFTGRQVPPVEKNSDGDVIAMVRATVGAIGYVSADAAIGDLKVIQIQ